MEKRLEEKQRKSGILLPVSCLPGKFGIGDLGEGARAFVDWMRDAGVGQWSILPLNPTGFGNCPYQSPSAFAGNINYISPRILYEEELLSQSELDQAMSFSADGQVDYGRLFIDRPKLMYQAYDHFVSQGGVLEKTYLEFCRDNQEWLEEYVAFMSIKEQMGYQPWYQWPVDLAHRREPGLSHYLSGCEKRMGFWRFVQFEFFRQWNRLKEYTCKQGIEIIGDMPFYVAHDSADVWCHRELFDMDPENGRVRMWAGVPSDDFSENDRNWGNPVYSWESHEADGYQWFRRRIRMNGKMYDYLRIDHAIALRRFFGIKENEKTGAWYDGPDLRKEKLTDAICEEAEHMDLSIIAEDLGKVPPGLREEMHKAGWPGMRVLQFAFTGKYGTKSNHLPFYHEKDMVIYTGTHDHLPLKDYLKNKSDEELRYIRWWTGKTTLEDLHWAFIAEAYKSVANQVVIPMQDILEAGGESRMVFQDDYNRSWKWRMKDLSVLTPNLAGRLKKLAVLTGRFPVTEKEFFAYLDGAGKEPS